MLIDRAFPMDMNIDFQVRRNVLIDRAFPMALKGSSTGSCEVRTCGRDRFGSPQPARLRPCVFQALFLRAKLQVKDCFEINLAFFHDDGKCWSEAQKCLQTESDGSHTWLGC